MKTLSQGPFDAHKDDPKNQREKDRQRQEQRQAGDCVQDDVESGPC